MAAWCGARLAAFAPEGAAKIARQGVGTSMMANRSLGMLRRSKVTGAAKGDEPVTAERTWGTIQTQAEAQIKKLSLSPFGVQDLLCADVLEHHSLGAGLAFEVGSKLSANSQSGHVKYREIMLSAFSADPSICDAVAADIERFKVVDPACDGLLGVYMFYKGVHALACARVAHHFWTEGGETGKIIARLLQSEMADVFGVDIHPGCRLGKGVTIDHATGVTLGETCVIGDNVYIMHDVTLGATGTSKEHDRHPKIGNEAFLGAKCTVLGNVRVGNKATVAAAALVMKQDVPDGYTAVGMPPSARLIAPKADRLSEDDASAMDLGQAMGSRL